MFRSVIFAILCMVVVGGTVACSKEEKNLLPERQRTRSPKLPPIIPTDGNPSNPQVSDDVTRTLKGNLSIDSTLVSDWGLYTPDNCAQFVNYKKGTQNLGDFVELGKEGCPGSGVQAKENIVIVLTAELYSWPDVYDIKDPVHDITIGSFQAMGSSMEITDLCTGSYSSQCEIKIEASKFSGIDVYMDYLYY